MDFEFERTLRRTRCEIALLEKRRGGGIFQRKDFSKILMMEGTHFVLFFPCSKHLEQGRNISRIKF